MIISCRPRRYFAQFSRSNLSRSYAWRANALTTRTPLRFSWSTVERVASCSWYFSYAFDTRLKKKYEMTITSGTTITESHASGRVQPHHREKLMLKSRKMRPMPIAWSA